MCSSSREAGAEWITAEAATSWLRNDLSEKDKEGGGRLIV